MTVEERLRRAIEDRTSSVEVDEDAGLRQVTDRLAGGSPGGAANGGSSGAGGGPSRRLLIAAAAAAVAVAAVAAGLVVAGDDEPGNRIGMSGPDATDEPEPATTAPDTAAPSTAAPTTTAPTTTAPTTTAPTTTAPTEPGTGDEAPQDEVGTPGLEVVWPRPSSDVRFDDPVAAARSFALYYARFDDPVVGAFRPGDSRSGEVPVQARPGGPETTVLVRQVAGDDWFVIASVTADITVDRPAAGSTLSCPMATSGSALAFEGTVQVRVDAFQPDGDRVELGRGFVTGSGAPPAGPFSGQVPCSRGTGVEPAGLVAYWTGDESGELTGPLQFVSFPVRLG